MLWIVNIFNRILIGNHEKNYYYNYIDIQVIPV